MCENAVHTRFELKFKHQKTAHNTKQMCLCMVQRNSISNHDSFCFSLTLSRIYKWFYLCFVAAFLSPFLCSVFSLSLFRFFWFLFRTLNFVAGGGCFWFYHLFYSRTHTPTHTITNKFPKYKLHEWACNCVSAQMYSYLIYQRYESVFLSFFLFSCSRR